MPPSFLKEKKREKDFGGSRFKINAAVGSLEKLSGSPGWSWK